jgi:uncharacterized protein
MFVANLAGILMQIEEDPVTRYRYEIWFDYTRKAMNTIAEGAMLAVPNFGGSAQKTCYSILEVTGILPLHYALGDDIRGYPGFVVEAARNASQDWVTQDQASTEDTTKIKCIAIPTNLEIVERPFATRDDKPIIQEESNVPMVGHEVNMLDSDMTERLVNRSLDLDHENAIKIGTLVRDPKVGVYLRVEDFIKVHFGIFGFTGAGKSNLLSTIIRRLLTESAESVKIVIFDLMSEYTGLLLDQLVDLEGGSIINIGAQTVPESVLTYFSQRSTTTQVSVDKENLRQATIDLVMSSVLPKSIKRRQSDLHRPVAKLLHHDRILFLRQQQRTIGDVIKGAQEEFKKTMGNSTSSVRQFVRGLTERYGGLAPEPDTIQTVDSQIQDFQDTPKLTETAIQNLELLRDRLGGAASKPQESVPASVQIGTRRIIDQLNDPTSKALIIVQSHDPDALREFAATLAGIVYESRRKTGQITPLVSFIFDEADEFIPGETRSDSQKSAKAAVMTLARRGRKFGIGVGIATQRIRYLDTSILAQPHTYFVSKLPRFTDRQAIGEAFGFSEEMFRQTFKFKKGDWLLASYDAAGLEAIPVPIHADNADEHILKFIDEQRRPAQEQLLRTRELPIK